MVRSGDPLLNFGTLNRIFGLGEAMRFKFGGRIDTVQYWCMHNRLLQRLTWPI